MSTDQFANLLAALAGVIALPGAACAGRWDLFDERGADEDDDDWAYRSAAAARICQECSALAGCQRWYADLPKMKRPPGIVAGRILEPRRPGRPAKEA